MKLPKTDNVLIDVRSKSEFASGSINNALNIPVDQLLNYITTLPRNKKIIIFCTNGNRSKAAKTILEHNGFKDIEDASTMENVLKLL